MKKLFFFLLITFSIILISCNNETASTSSSNSEEQRNLAADSIVSNSFHTGDVSKIDSVVAADFVDHTDHGDKNRDSLKAMIKMVHDSFPDAKMEMINQAAKGEYVYSWMRFTGTSNGAMGMPPGPYDMKAIEVTKFKDGKAVEHWEFMEMREMMKMMQNMGGPAANNK